MVIELDVAGEWSAETALDGAFLQVAGHVYAGDREWFPEDARQLGYLFSRHHAYFSYGKVWLGFSEKRARLAGFFDPRLQIDGERCAYFGFWETVDDGAINQALFSQFEAWAKAHGATCVYGPINFNTYGLYRIRTNDFGKPAFQGEPYNPHYYPALLQALGYAPVHQYNSSFDEDIPSFIRGMEPAYRRGLDKMGDRFVLQPLTPDFWMQNIEQIYRLSELVFQSNFAYTPINLDIFRQVCGQSFVNKIHPQASFVATDKVSGDIASMLICFPSWGPLLCQGANPRVDAAAIEYTQHVGLLPKPRLALAKTAGTDPRFRGYGIYSVMMYELAKAAHETGFEHYCGALAKEDNASLNMIRHASHRRTYALYRKSLA